MSLGENWILQVDSLVFAALKKIPRRDAERIFVIIGSLPLNPFAGDIQKMKGESNTWRRRIGSFRIFYELMPSEKVIHVFRVERRTSKTY